jgi:tetratricopeptide (TPR) repeat protein
MVTKKSFKKGLYENWGAYQFLNCLFIFLIAAVAVILISQVIWSSRANLFLNILLLAVGLGIFIAWIMVWGWYSVLFRYLAYGVARVIAGIRSFLSSTIIQLVIILGLSAWFWVWRKSFFPKKVKRIPIDINFWEEVLKLDSLLKILVIAAALFTMWKLFQSRKRIVICDFENFTDKKELGLVVKGLASICSNEMSRLSKLLKTYDDIQLDATTDMAKVDLNLDVQDIGKDFEEIIDKNSNIKIGNVVTIPIKNLYVFFRKLLQGPMLTGGVHLKGDKFTLTASLKGGKYKGNWQITFDESEIYPKSESEKLNKLTERLVCRMLTDLSPGITPRWKAMYHFTEGLRLYRETLRTEEKRKLNYIKAKDAFSQAVRDDEKFVQCYYNFGIIYKKLKSWEAAEAAFREALKKKPDYHQCYYQLAEIYCENYYKGKTGVKFPKEYSLSDAQWLCQQAVTICPSEPSYWDLLAVIRSYMWLQEEQENGRNKEKQDGDKEESDIPDEILRTSMTGTMLAWRALCKSIIKGEKTSKYKDTVLICIRNLAVLTGMNNEWSSRCLFGQALFLNPDNNDLHFERGKSFYSPLLQTGNNNKVKIDKKNAKKAYNAFKRVFEDDVDVNDPFSFWAFYINVNAKLCEQEEDKKKKKKYEDVVDNGYIHFLDAAAEIIHKDKNYQNGMIQRNEGLVSEAFDLINAEKKYHQTGFLKEFIKFLKDEQSNKNIVNWRKRTNKKISRYCKRDTDDFFTWMAAQRDVKSSTSALKQKKKNYFEYAISKLTLAKEKLKNKHPNEIKMIGLYRHLATAYLLSESYDKALKSAREAARLSPYEPGVRDVLGNVYFEMKDYKQGIKELQICFHLDYPEMDILQKKKILEKIGEAYIKEGEILRDPATRKESFTKAAEFFKECHDIIEDKSYDPDAREYESYIDTLGRTHFNLGYFYHELLQYDDVISHYQTALEMAKAIRSNVDILEILLRMGWVYIEMQAFVEAERTFNNAASEDKQKLNQEDALLINVEIAIGIMFSKVERGISIDRDTIFEVEDTAKNWAVNTEANWDRIKMEDKEWEKKARLLALYHECLGRYYFKQGKMNEFKREEMNKIIEEFDESIKYMPNPRVYLYLAEFYLPEVPKYRLGRKETLIAKARNAFKLCRQTDLRQQYKQDVDDLEKKLEALEK